MARKKVLNPPSTEPATKLPSKLPTAKITRDPSPEALRRLREDSEEPIRKGDDLDPLDDLDGWWKRWSDRQDHDPITRRDGGVYTYAPRVQTSEDSPLKVDFYIGIPRTWGKLGGTFCPGKKDGVKWDRDLDTDLRVLKEANVDVLLSLPEDFELADRKVSDLASRAREYGITVIRFPMPDHCPPRSIEAAKIMVDSIIALLKGGLNVVVHCVGGRGRTGTLAGCLLVAAGMSAENALKVARAARQGAAENPAQERFVRAYWLLYGVHTGYSGSGGGSTFDDRDLWPRR